MDTKTILTPDTLEDKVTALSESEMQLFRFLLEKPYGAILTVDTDKMIAQLLASDGLLEIFSEDKVQIPLDVMNTYHEIWSDEKTLKWRKRNWMYKCLEAGKNLYGVMTWQVLKDLFGVMYPNAGMDEVQVFFDTTPEFYQWFTERNGKLVLNGFEKNNYYEYLEQQIQGDIPFYIPTRKEIEELFDHGSLISREAHAKLRDYLVEAFDCSDDTAEIKVHDLYECVNRGYRVNDAIEVFTKGLDENSGKMEFPSDEVQVKFIELYMEMSRECRIRDNRGHDSYEMVAIMADKDRKPVEIKKAAQVKRVKIGRNDPCPCGSGKKYKNCCGRLS